MVNVELIYIKENKDVVQMELSLEPGSTLADALQKSAWMERYPEITSLSYGIFSRPKSLNTVLNSGDRVEIYRPLLVDPKEKRRQRALNV